MATPLKAVSAPESNALSAFLADPSSVLNEDGLIDQIIDELKRQNADLPGDMGAVKNREARASAAYAIARMKSPIETKAKAMTEGWRKLTADVNARRKSAVEKLDTLQRDIRAPLTEWEDAEKARQDQVATVFERLVAAAELSIADTPELVAQRIEAIQGFEIAEDLFRERHEEAERRRALAIETLEAAKAKLEQEARDKAELERLRREAAEREAAERMQTLLTMRAEEEEAAEHEAAELARQEAEARKAEDEARAAEAAEAAAAKAREDERKAAEEERKRIEDEAAAKVQAAQDEADRLRREQEAREAEAAEQAAEQTRRETNQRHRAAVSKKAAAAIEKAAGVTPEQAEKIVDAIKAGDVPHTTIQF